jgi:photosystem II stability/assembly factor-like uncharacterized protein
MKRIIVVLCAVAVAGLLMASAVGASIDDYNVYYDFETGNGTTCYDQEASDSYNDCTLYGGCSWDTGLEGTGIVGNYGYGLGFDGVDDWADDPDRYDDPGLTQEACSVGLWLKLNSGNTDEKQGIFSNGAIHAYANISGSGSTYDVKFQWHDSDGNWSNVNYQTATPDVWEHWVFTASSDTAGDGYMRIYKNGELLYDTDVTYPGYHASGWFGHIKMGYIGEHQYLDGTLDEVKVWDRELSESEVTELYESYTTSIEDYSIYYDFESRSGAICYDQVASDSYNDCTLYGDISWVPGLTGTLDYYGYGLGFDGVNDWADDPDRYDDPGLTQEASSVVLWLKLNSGTTDEKQGIFSNGAIHSYVNISNSGGTYGVKFQWRDTESGISNVDYQTAVPDVWEHWAFTASSDTAGDGYMRIYKNSELLDETDVTYPGFCSSGFFGHVRMGYIGEHQYLDGIMDEVKVWDRELSGSEVTELYESYEKSTWIPKGPGAGGMATAIACDPSDTDTWYFCSDVGGVYKTTDGGSTWFGASSGIGNPYVYDIAVNPGSTNIIYIATKGGVFKTVDAGDNWVSKRVGFPAISDWSLSEPVFCVAIDPFDTDTIYAGIGEEGKIYRSTDAASNWSVVNTPGSPIADTAVINDIAFSPKVSGTMYAATDDGFYKSTDSGVNWTAKNTGLPSSTINRIELNPDTANDTDVLYITVYVSDADPWDGGVYKSTNSAEDTWISKSNGLGQATGSGFQGSQYRSLAIDPNDTDILYVADHSWRYTRGLYKTTNSGDTWTLITSDSVIDTAIWNNDLVDCQYDVKALSVHPVDSDYVMIGTSFEILKSTNGGSTWSGPYTSRSSSTADTWTQTGQTDALCVTCVTVDPSDTDRVYVGVADVQMYKSEDAGASFEWCGYGINPDGGQHPFNWTYSIVVDPDSSAILYAGAGGRRNTGDGGALYKSTDYGDNWSYLAGGDTGSGSLGDNEPISLIIDPSGSVGSRTMYALLYKNGVYKSTDSGQNWTAKNNGFVDSQYLETLVMAPGDTDTLYAGCTLKKDGSGYIDGGVYRTSDGGDSWIRITPAPNGPYYKYNGEPTPIDVQAIAVDANDTNRIYIGASDNMRYDNGGVFKTVNGGDTWTQVYDGSHKSCIVRSIAIDGNDTSIIYAGLYDGDWHDMSVPDSGFIISTDDGASWTEMGGGISVPRVRCMTVVEDTGTNGPVIYLGTHGNGVYKSVGLIE